MTLESTQIVQAISNVISSALRFSPSGAPVEVAVRADRHWVDIEVSDEVPVSTQPTSGWTSAGGGNATRETAYTRPVRRISTKRAAFGFIEKTATRERQTMCAVAQRVIDGDLGPSGP